MFKGTQAKVVIKASGEIIDASGVCVDACTGLVSVYTSCSDEKTEYEFEAVEVIRPVNRKDMEGTELYYGDVIEFKPSGLKARELMFIKWDVCGTCLQLLGSMGMVYHLSRANEGRKVGNIFADPKIMQRKTED